VCFLPKRVQSLGFKFCKSNDYFVALACRTKMYCLHSRAAYSFDYQNLVRHSQVLARNSVKYQFLISKEAI
jgi:hypothetical protein